MAYCVSSVGLITVWIFKIVIAGGVIAGGVISFLAVVAVGLIISLCLAIGYIFQPQYKREEYLTRWKTRLCSWILSVFAALAYVSLSILFKLNKNDMGNDYISRDTFYGFTGFWQFLAWFRQQPWKKSETSDMVNDPGDVNGTRPELLNIV